MAPLGRATVGVEAELVSNLDNDRAVGGFGVHVGSTAAQSFRTGSSSRSYGLTAVRFRARTTSTPGLVVSIHEDNSGDPAATVLFTLTGPAIRGFSSPGVHVLGAGGRPTGSGHALLGGVQ